MEAQGDKTQKTEQLFQVKATEQQTTKLDIGMGLPFNVNSHRRQYVVAVRCEVSVLT